MRYPKVRRIKGSFAARGRRFGIVVSEFNEYLTNSLLEGALDTLVRHGAKEKDIYMVYVPGAFEIPLGVKRILLRRKLDAVITLAVVIRGETKHFDQVVEESARGIREIAQGAGIPVILGMVSADTVDQAIRRVGVKHLNKGREWALAAIEMANLLRK
ncbi:MAG: 6,7-dimethyl-8-ribityllumazine synthase [Candidatus Omnitrophica bacterium]|nr:6,7-dimethyl-8-ribityllumazine synthase [Candidatus Omnitrophota bacterium]